MEINFHFLLYLVRVDGDDPSSYPWEGYIIAVIRYPLAFLIIP